MSDDLVAFLRARLDQDERIAKAAAPGPWHWVQEGRGDKITLVSGPWLGHDAGGWREVLPIKGTGPDIADADHLTRHDPARVLREVEAKRAILARYERGASGDLPEWRAGRELIEAGTAILLGVIRDHAAVYRDHPDYQQEWAP